MKKYISKYLSESQTEKVIGISALVIVLAIGYFIYNLSNQIMSLKSDFASTTLSFESRINALQSDLATTTQVSKGLSQQIVDQQNRSDNIGQALNSISSTVGTLAKLSQTDKELLQKYSKVYFLNENYIPMKLATIDQKYLQDKNKSLQFHATALTYLTRMLDDALGANSPIQVASAYRSFGTQAALKSSYTVAYGSGANKFSSDQGYSEHQLGTAVDLSAPNTNTLLMISFDGTPAFNWLRDNAFKYGFVMSYPKTNAYYQYEPWHWRFVGVKLATYLHAYNKNFYDFDQREIDTYLVNIFD